jgi:hypothetical protein
MSLRNLILQNFWLKFFSIALATVIWLAIYHSIHNEENLNIRVPVSIQTTPGDKRVFRVIPDEVVVIAIGKRAALFHATRKDIHVYVDLTSFDATESTSQELKADAPPDVNVLEIIPSTVEVQQVSP